MESKINRDQLIAEILNERSFSAQRYANGGEIDLRVGATPMHGLPITLPRQMRSKAARLAGYNTADLQQAAAAMADQIIADDEELIADMRAGDAPFRA